MDYHLGAFKTKLDHAMTAQAHCFDEAAKEKDTVAYWKTRCCTFVGTLNDSVAKDQGSEIPRARGNGELQLKKVSMRGSYKSRNLALSKLGNQVTKCSHYYQL